MTEPAGIKANLFDEAARRARRRDALHISVVLLLALGLRLVFTYQVETSPVDALRRIPSVAGAGTYDQIARRVLANGWFEKGADVPPVYPYVFLPLAYLVSGGSVLWAKYAQGFLDTATVFFIYLIARRLYDRRAGIFAGLAAAVYAPFIVYQGQILHDCLLVFFVAAFFVVLTGIRGRISLKRAAALGALAGLAIATMPTAAIFLPLAFVWVWRRAVVGLLGLTKLIAPAAIAAAATAAVLVPFMWRNHRATGAFAVMEPDCAYMFYMGNNPAATGAYASPADADELRIAAETADVTPAERRQLYRDAALRFITQNPGKELGLLARKFRLFFGAAEIPDNLSIKLFRQTTFLKPSAFATFGLVLPFAAAGFLFSIRRRGVPLVAAQAALYSAAIIAFVVVDRYRLVILPLVLPAAGFAVSELLLAVKTVNFVRTAAIALAVAILAALVNWFDLSTAIRERLHPDGFAERSGSVTWVHDDSDYATPFSAYLSDPDGTIVKVLVVREPVEDIDAVSVLIQLAVGQPGVLTVELNGQSQQKYLDTQPRSWLRVPFPPASVKEGPNELYLSGDGALRAVVFADDVYHFGRSHYTPDGKHYMSDYFDHSSYKLRPALHIGGREFKIRLELQHGGSNPELQ